LNGYLQSNPLGPLLKKGDELFARFGKKVICDFPRRCVGSVPLGEGGKRGIGFRWFCGYSRSNPPGPLLQKGDEHIARFGKQVICDFFRQLSLGVSPLAKGEKGGLDFAGFVVFCSQIPLPPF
jgi:hypothetical protein